MRALPRELPRARSCKLLLLSLNPAVAVHPADHATEQQRRSKPQEERDPTARAPTSISLHGPCLAAWPCPGKVADAAAQAEVARSVC